MNNHSYMIHNAGCPRPSKEISQSITSCVLNLKNKSRIPYFIAESWLNKYVMLLQHLRRPIPKPTPWWWPPKYWTTLQASNKETCFPNVFTESNKNANRWYAGERERTLLDTLFVGHENIDALPPWPSLENYKQPTSDHKHLHGASIHYCS